MRHSIATYQACVYELWTRKSIYMRTNDFVGNAPFSLNNSNNYMLPAGWLMEHEDGAYVAGQPIVPGNSLKAATRVSEQLLDLLETRTGIHVSTAYLNVMTDGTYNLLLLVDETAYHSPAIRAAHILIEEYVQMHTELSIRFNFTIEREYATNTTAADMQRLKYVHDSVGGRA
jgi:hypothetical protein